MQGQQNILPKITMQGQAKKNAYISAFLLKTEWNLEGRGNKAEEKSVSLSPSK